MLCDGQRDGNEGEDDSVGKRRILRAVVAFRSKLIKGLADVMITM